VANSALVWAATRNASAGVFYRAVLAGTTLPTDAISSLHANYKDQGWLTDDGIINSINRDTTKHHSFGGDVIKVTQDNYEETIQVTLAETNENGLKTTFGDANVTVVTSPNRKITVNHSQAQLPRCTFVVQTIDGVKTRRVLIREGQVTGVDDIEYRHDGLTVYKLTIDVFKPSSGADAVTEFIDEPDAFTEPSGGVLVLAGSVPTVIAT